MAPRQAKSQFLALLVSISLLVTPTSADVWPTTGVCGSRVRYSWDSLTSNDKQLYRDAISTAMSTGYHALFVEVHSDLTSFREAHNTCGMMFWHRRYLLAYEQMLRSLGTRFACITIPYWDYFADYAKFLANTCTTFENCSTFLRDMGGSSGPSVSLSINGFTVNGNCVNGLSSSYADFTNFCEKSNMNGSACAGCIPRGSWSTTNFPSGFCYSSLAKYLSLQYGYAWFSQNIHWGVHQSIHNAALGALVTYPTSADPVFYSHHATVDLIQQLYFNCQIGRVLSDSDKQTGAYAYQTCSVANYPVESHPILGQFFAYQPKEYWHYVSATDMGNMSYSYASDDLFALLQSEGLSCPQDNTRKLFDASYVDVPVTASSKAKAIGRSYNLYQDIIDAASANTSTESDAIDQGETLDCLWYDENFGVDDFTAEFRENWKLPSTAHTVCYNRCQDVKYGRRQVKVSDWKDKYMFHYFEMTDTELASASDITPTVEAAMIGSGSTASTPTATNSTTVTTAPTVTSSTPTTAPTTVTSSPTTSPTTSTSTTSTTTTTP
ncbi:uncharacterized protein IUM83_04820 [Phytophthora cinnamomi]|uniref:uncharacterized protein n=1 Tax=Phytophthora cinnamomi TaxID=4785 RepID=UPI00355A360B|nr:hypothetical protein IUM83_04820 [Phytophthora cinnamomi]